MHKKNFCIIKTYGIIALHQERDINFLRKETKQ